MPLYDPYGWKTALSAGGRPAQIYQSEAAGFEHGFDSRMHAQLPEDATDVVSHGVRTETQNLRNAASGLALRKKR